VLDKNVSLGARGGATAIEVRDALYGTAIPVKGYVLGLGGRDIRKKDIKEIVALSENGTGDLFYGLKKELI
jgi:pyruvate ferredoxin oxidoreductase alpha subunit